MNNKSIIQNVLDEPRKLFDECVNIFDERVFISIKN